MTDEELKAIEARANAATPGPWTYDDTKSDWIRCAETLTFPPGKGAPIQNRGLFAPLWFNSPEDCRRNGTFVAHARTDVPALVAEVRRLRADVVTLERQLVEQAKIHGRIGERSAESMRERAARRAHEESCAYGCGGATAAAIRALPLEDTE